MRRNVSAALLALLVGGCSAITQQKAQAPKPDQLEFKNLKVLSPNITHDELIATMRGFARSLGTRCEHCHVVTAKEPREQFDFASDAKPEKTVARTMIRMTRDLNEKWISKVNEHGQTATCATCHRGRTVPEQWTPPQPPAGGAPQNPAPAPSATNRQ